MKIVISTQIRSTFVVRNALFLFAFFIAFLHFPSDIFAEGSKDFMSYPGKRLFLDTRDNQQMKVYAAAGEFINVGSSHINIQGGFIDVYRPDGTFHVRFDNSALDNTGIIFDNIQEANGPIGFGNGGFKPGVIAVDADNAGVWTVIFDYPGESEENFTNIDNDSPWTRFVHQPNSQRVVLAWDITVSQNAAANQVGANLLTGRVYSNKYVSEILGNGNQTSPTYYILSRDGFTYKVDFNEIDPFRFTVGSNSFGIVDGDQSPIYESVAVGDYSISSNPSAWASDELYLYQLMAEDSEALINNKVFFNPPATDLPASATVTDIFATTPNTHTTWLTNTPVFNPTINFSNFSFLGFDEDGIECDPNTAQTGIGGFAVFDTNLGGTTTLQLDLNGDNDFDDPIDRNIFAFVEAGTDSIFWDGNDGMGNPLPIQEGFVINYNLTVRGGEIHIPIIDVENNPGGVTLALLNESGMPEPTEFFYNNTNVGGGISGGGTGEPQPTTQPFTYDSNFGNNKIFDYWTYIQFTGDGSGTFTIDISENCVCQEDTTPAIIATAEGSADCEGTQIATLTATNSQADQGEVYFTYLSGDEVIGRDTVMNSEVSTLNLGPSSTSLSGEYSVFAVNERGCFSDTIINSLIIDTLPILQFNDIVTTNTTSCAGDTLTFNASIFNGDLNYILEVLTPDNNMLTPIINSQNESLSFSLPDLTQNGTYAVNIGTESDCKTATSFNVQINEIPEITSFFQNVPATFCQSDSIVLSADITTTGTYTLTLPDATTITGDIDGTNPISYVINDVSEEDMGLYSLNVVSSTGCVSETSSLTVSALPNTVQSISAEGAGAYCEGEEVVILAFNDVEGTGDLTYTITGGQTDITQTIAATDTVTLTISDFSSADAGTYSLTVVGDCETTVIPFDLETIESVSYSNVTGEGLYCENEAVTLSAQSSLPESITVSYTWTGPDFEFTGTAAGNGPFEAVIESVAPENIGTYTLTLSSDDFSCEIGETSLEINVNEIPVIDNITGGGTYCQLTPVSLSAENTNTNLENVTYTWLAPDGFTYTETVAGDEPLVFNTGEINENWNGIWSLIVVSEQGCAADTIPVDVNIEPSIVIFDLQGGGTFCAGETIEMSAFNGNPNVDEVIWSWENPNGIFAEGTVNGTELFTAMIENISVQDTGTYVLLMSSENACPIGVGTFTVEVENAPIIELQTESATACPGESINLIGTNTAEFTGDITYTWTGPNGFIQTGVGGPDDDYIAIIPNINAENAGTYTLTLASQNGCVAEEDVTAEVIVLDASIDAGIEVNNNIACEGDEIVFNAEFIAEGTQYDWFYTDNGETVLISSGTDATLTISPFSFDDAGEYFVTITNGCGNVVSSNPIIISTLSGVDAFEDEAETDQTMSVDIPVMNNDLMGNNSGFNYVIITPPTNGEAEFNSDATVTYTPNEEFSGLDSLQYQICSDLCPNNCDLAWVYINVTSEDCFYPNYFTPNGDDNNPVFFVDCLDTAFPDNNITIFNRWGDEVYSAEPYNNDWDGTRDGTELPAGTYFYLLNLTPDGENCKQGFITIIK